MKTLLLTCIVIAIAMVVASASSAASMIELGLKNR